MSADGHPSQAPWGLPSAGLVAAELASRANGRTAAGLVDFFTPSTQEPVSIRPIQRSDEPLLKAFMLGLQQAPDMDEWLRTVQRAMHHQREIFAALALSASANGADHVVGLGTWCAASQTSHSALRDSNSMPNLAHVQLVIAPSRRRCGVGSRLLQMLVLGAAVRRVRTLSLHVPGPEPLSGPWARALARAGWVPTLSPDDPNGSTLQREVPPLAQCLRHLQRPRKRERMRMAGALPMAWDTARP